MGYFLNIDGTTLKRRLLARRRRARPSAGSFPDLLVDPTREDYEQRWFWQHYRDAAGQIVNFCQAQEVALAGREIADVGCGDGIMALGLCQHARPKRLVGFDIVATNTEILLERARSAGVAEALPAELEFRASEPVRLPAEDDAFDFVYSWSAFEHIATPAEVLGEIRRVLRPGGSFFLQLWPFYRSAHGSHLWDWFNDEFHHLTASMPDTVAAVQASDRHSPEHTAYMVREFQHLNQVTLDELQRAALAAGFTVSAFELITAPVKLTPALQRYAWCDLAVGGIKLLAQAQ